jgi:hypothetical protein
VVGWADDVANSGSGAAQAAAGALGGGPATRTALGAPARPAASFAPFTLPDRCAAVASINSSGSRRA